MKWINRETKNKRLKIILYTFKCLVYNNLESRIEKKKEKKNKFLCLLVSRVKRDCLFITG